MGDANNFGQHRERFLGWKRLRGGGHVNARLTGFHGKCGYVNNSRWLMSTCFNP